jgi:hypothetical protein
MGLVLATLAATTACSGDSSTAPTTTSLAGVYALRQIEQTALPVEVYRGPFYHEIDARQYTDFEVTLTGGTLQLDDAGAYHTTLNYKALKDGVEENSSLRGWGTYQIQGNRITLLRDNGFDGAEGTISGSSITLGIDVIGKGVVKPYTFVK